MNKRMSYIGIYVILSLVFGILFLVALTLKLSGTIELSWALVFCPIWLPIISAIASFSAVMGYITLKDRFGRGKYITKDIYD